VKPLPLLLLLLAAGCSPPTPPPPPAPSSPAQASVGEPRDEPIEPGRPFPPFQAEGWLNGTPPTGGEPGARATVIDLWSEWCPYCRQAAPGLIELHRKYADKGVLFVSLTNMPKEAAERFDKEFGVTWPSGYGAAAETFAAYGAGNAGLYVVAPTFYLLGPDGKVIWCDGRSRYRHKEPAETIAELDARIAKVLTR
jgi:thiol-disulfide isomerase/thioredoxin